jgi:hypothetical protein
MGQKLYLGNKIAVGTRDLSPSPHQVHMEMENELPPAPFHIKDQFVAGTGYARLLCEVFGRHDELGNHRPIRLHKIVYAADMLFGNNENVNRGMGLDIFEGKDGISLIHEISGLFAANDLTKDTLPFQGYPPVSSSPNPMTRLSGNGDDPILSKTPPVVSFYIALFGERSMRIRHTRPNVLHVTGFPSILLEPHPGA